MPQPGPAPGAPHRGETFLEKQPLQWEQCGYKYFGLTPPSPYASQTCLVFLFVCFSGTNCASGAALAQEDAEPQQQDAVQGCRGAPQPGHLCTNTALTCRGAGRPALCLLCSARSSLLACWRQCTANTKVCRISNVELRGNPGQNRQEVEKLSMARVQRARKLDDCERTPRVAKKISGYLRMGTPA
ncbi:uncharacterized protein LOC126913166 [Cygnus atratus]|uniref:uncharacterized protein LOC126913166 n=1 Tax=Cygnus atratus TaxID=8868 RepID=UPI0021B751D8|nr:uncharacterized protein LOC126913166 [Cygnus atratus]